MKNVYKHLFGSALAGSLAISLIGCAGEQAASNAAATTTALPTAPTTSGTTTTVTTTTGIGTDTTVTGLTGSTVSLQVTGSALSSMFYKSLPNNPTNIRLSLDTTRVGSEVIIAYDANGYTTQARLGSVHPWNPGHSNTSYNGWTNDGTTSLWKGFFQDGYGAVVVVVDSNQSTGDGNAGLIGGEIYFQNFPQSTYPNSPYAPAQGPLKMCWEITAGPYDCRTFLVGDNVAVNSSRFPNNLGPNATNYYRQLGTFTGLSRSAAGI